jgi:hypothetical protein
VKTLEDMQTVDLDDGRIEVDPEIGQEVFSAAELCKLEVKVVVGHLDLRLRGVDGRSSN